MNQYAGFKDAMHVPYVLVKSNADLLMPGTRCSLRHDNLCVPWGGRPEDVEPMWHGVVDPFLDGPVNAGELFALWIRKECFTRLRHDFEIEVHDRGGTATCHSVCDIF